MSETAEAAPQAVEETTEATAESPESTTEQASAETENTETVEAGKSEPGPVPYSRFREVNEERKAMKARLERIEAQLAEKAESKKPEATAPAQPPEDLDADSKVKWYVEHYARGLIERELGLSLENVKAVLGVTRELSSEHAERRWADLCKANGVDPANQEVRKEAAALLRSGVPADKAAKVAAMIVKSAAPKPGPKPGKPANVEDGGMDSTQMTREDWIAWSKEDATEAAKTGKKMPHMTAEQIFAKAKQRGK